MFQSWGDTDRWSVSESHLTRGKKGTFGVFLGPGEDHGCVQDVSGAFAGDFTAAGADLLGSGERRSLFVCSSSSPGGRTAEDAFRFSERLSSR